MRGIGALLAFALMACALAQAGDKATVQVGSKRFTESYLVGEIVTQTLRRAGEVHAEHRPGLGNTAVVFAALRSGAVDIYPDYTGTVALELLRLDRVPDLPELNERLAEYGIAAGIPLGYSNSYALAMSAQRANELGITKLSQLREHPDLRYSLSQEFMHRRDGWPGLASEYGLRPRGVTGLDHGLAYEAIASGNTDLIDVYTTDPKLDAYRLRVLEDDRRFFPAYDAILLYRADLPRRYPASWAALGAVEGTLSADRMRGLNAEVELSGKRFDAVAAEFLGDTPSATGSSSGWRRMIGAIFAPDLWRLTREHVALVFVSLAVSVLIGIPLGWCAHAVPRGRHGILGAVGMLQTIPALALLAVLVAGLNRIGTIPALVALVLYALLPIVRNTQTGLDGVPRGLRQAATALGLDRGARLRLIELPLAAPAIVAGIRTAAVINVGTATIAAFVGAGGYGERIVAGLAVHDSALLVAGAAPAAALALALEAGFHIAEKRWMPGARAPLE
ncbi:MAG TPA: glycine betaine ABC transporter substrate-binding protein [Burkholderiales bacterium]